MVSIICGGSCILCSLLSLSLSPLGKPLLLLRCRCTGTDNVDQVGNRTRRLCALSDPSVNLLEVELNGFRVGQRVIAADFLKGATVALLATVYNDNTIVWMFFGSVTSKANLNCQ